ncbi:OmpA family protein [bacterium]|nr:OmpA family protein [bacterium]
MAGQSNAAPVIIKRKKIIMGGGHHGGAWKVAYADFVTAMMAFFMLMWLLGATTEKQRKGIADYFNPTIPINRVSGGGTGAFGGDSIFTDRSLAHDGTGQSAATPGELQKSGGVGGDTAGQDAAAQDAQLKRLQSALEGKGGESATMQTLLSHVVTKVTDEGLVVEIFDTEGTPLFTGETASPTDTMTAITSLLSEVLGQTQNQIAVDGYVHAYPVMIAKNPSWDLSSSRAQVVRQLLENAGMPTSRISRVSGHADRKPVTADPTAARNNRIEVVLLRKNR